MASDSLRYLALGDSYTIGEGVDPAVRWPVLLADALRARGIPVAPPTVIAETGWTTDELDEAIDRAEDRRAESQGPFDLVSLLIGVNNQYRGRSVEDYRTEFRGLLQRAIGFAGGDAGCVLVLSIPDWGVTPFATGDERTSEEIGEAIDAYNVAACEETEAAGALFVDITPLFRTRPFDSNLVVEDGLHPSGRVYAAWAERALPTAFEALKDRAR